jgi:peptidoglycan/xylan/chitin deacetylase (PgdA/CDA1 family)
VTRRRRSAAPNAAGSMSDRVDVMVIAVVALLLAVAMLAHTAPAPFLLETSPRHRSLWRVPAQAEAPPTVYLTFDDGPNVHWTPPLLEALRDSDVRATFFVIDRHITAATAAILRRAAADGHTIGVHTGSRRLVFASPSRVAREVQDAARRIAHITGRPPCAVFRPHAGWRSTTMYEGLRRSGYTLVGWSWGMWDWHWWQRPDGQRIADRLAARASAGDIVVIHDGHHKDPDADRRHAAEAVRALVPRLRERGFALAPLCTEAGVVGGKTSIAAPRAARTIRSPGIPTGGATDDLEPSLEIRVPGRPVRVDSPRLVSR